MLLSLSQSYEIFNRPRITKIEFTIVNRFLKKFHCLLCNT